MTVPPIEISSRHVELEKFILIRDENYNSEVVLPLGWQSEVWKNLIQQLSNFYKLLEVLISGEYLNPAPLFINPGWILQHDGRIQPEMGLVIAQKGTNCIILISCFIFWVDAMGRMYFLSKKWRRILNRFRPCTTISLLFSLAARGCFKYCKKGQFYWRNYCNKYSFVQGLYSSGKIQKLVWVTNNLCCFPILGKKIA